MQKVSFNNKNSVFFNALKEKVDTYFKSNDIKETGNFKYYEDKQLIYSIIN